MEPKGSKREQKVSKKEPKEAKRKPKGTKMEPKSDQNASKNPSSEKVTKKGAKSGEHPLFLELVLGPKIVKIAIFENIRVL